MFLTLLIIFCDKSGKKSCSIPSCRFGWVLLFLFFSAANNTFSNVDAAVASSLSFTISPVLVVPGKISLSNNAATVRRKKLSYFHLPHPFFHLQSIQLQKEDSSSNSSSHNDGLYNLQQQQQEKSFIPPNQYERMGIPYRGQFKSHIIFGTLLNPTLINRYEVYKNIYHDNGSSNIRGNDEKDYNKNNISCISNHQDDIVRVVVNFGQSLDGHPGIIHGGILALVIDDILGFAFEALGISLAVTANLAINYIQPVLANSTTYVSVVLLKLENRKLYFQARMKSSCYHCQSPTENNNATFLEATSLYIIPKEDSF